MEEGGTLVPGALPLVNLKTILSVRVHPVAPLSLTEVFVCYASALFFSVCLVSSVSCGCFCVCAMSLCISSSFSFRISYSKKKGKRYTRSITGWCFWKHGIPDQSLTSLWKHGIPDQSLTSLLEAWYTRSISSWCLGNMVYQINL